MILNIIFKKKKKIQRKIRINNNDGDNDDNDYNDGKRFVEKLDFFFNTEGHLCKNLPVKNLTVHSFTKWKPRLKEKYFGFYWTWKKKVITIFFF